MHELRLVGKIMSMCGAMTYLHTWAEVHDAMNLIPTEARGRNDPPRYNIRPTQELGFICERNGERQVKDGMWWLVPFWAKEKPKHATFNARSETAREKPTFRESFKSKRCLIPASGYYEWTKNEGDKGRDPHFIHLPENSPYCFAGLWAYNSNLDITSCTILTGDAAPEIADLHHRMPIILKRSAFDEWLSEETNADDAHTLLGQNHGSELLHYRVGRAVNKNSTSGSGLIEPIE